MKIEEAKLIPIKILVENLGGRYSHTDRKGDHWYYSPFRPEEKTPSFKINEKLNTWHDFGLASTFAHQLQSSGGDILDLWCEFHLKNRRFGVKEALQALERLKATPNTSEKSFTPHPSVSPSDSNKPALKLLKIYDSINFVGLVEEIQRRKISPQIANLYLKQAYILDVHSTKKYWGFLFANNKSGYELSIPNPKLGKSFKSSIGAKNITYIPPDEESNHVYVFEGYWDFLSWLELKKMLRPKHHNFILNSNSFANVAVEAIIQLKEKLDYAYLFLDNDKSGFETTHAMALPLEEAGLQIASMDGFYNGYKDVSEYLMASPRNNHALNND